MPQRTAPTSDSRPDLRRYDRLMATMRKASKPSRSVMTSAWSMGEVSPQSETKSQNEYSVYSGISDRSSPVLKMGVWLVWDTAPAPARECAFAHTAGLPRSTDARHCSKLIV